METSIGGTPVTLTMRPCTDVKGFQLSVMDSGEEKFLGLHSYTCEGYLDTETATCFDLNFADCGSDTVALSSGACRTGCLKYSINNTSEESTFMWSHQDPNFLAVNYEKYEALLLAENWLDKTYEESASFQLQCSDNQNWTFISPNQRLEIETYKN